MSENFYHKHKTQWDAKAAAQGEIPASWYSKHSVYKMLPKHNRTTGRMLADVYQRNNPVNYGSNSRPSSRNTNSGGYRRKTHKRKTHKRN